MSAKMKRRRAHARHKQTRALRREDGMFYAHGIIPQSAVAVAMCVCGAVEFSREWRTSMHDEFNESHSYCDDLS